MKIFCASCKTSTNHKILSDIKKVYTDDEIGLGWSVQWQILECQGCDLISGREIRTFEEDFDPETGGHIEYITLYPKRGTNLLQIKPYLNIPIEIRSIYRETIDTFNNQNNILCAVGLRALLEGICNNKGIKDGPLEIVTSKGVKMHTIRKKDLRGKISGLFEKGLLTKSHSELLHEHRYLGNDAVHDLITPTSHELLIAIQIIEHTIENIYELTAKAEYLQKAKLKS